MRAKYLLECLLVAALWLTVGAMGVGCAHKCALNRDCPSGQLCHKGYCCDLYGRIIK